MVLYWYIFGIVALLSLQSSVFQRRSLTSIGNFTFNGICIFLFIVLGFRYRVGGDWNTYQEYNADHLGLPFNSVYSPGNDPGYNFFNWLGANFLGGVILPNLVMAAIFIFGVHRFCLTLPRPFLGLLVSLPFLVWVVGAGYTRQAAALGLFLVALCYVRSGNVFGYLTFAGLSILFHKTAVGLLPFGLFLVPRLFSVRALSVALLFITVTGLLFYGFISANIHMLIKYLEHEYTSHGTTPRMVIIGLCALIFISFNSRFNIYLTEKRFWSVFSSAGLFIILISLSSISSTPFDRILLYWLPLKMYLLAHLPSAFSQDVGNSRGLIIISIILFAASMQFVWFSYSPNAYAWSPYLFFPWEIVWGDA